MNTTLYPELVSARARFKPMRDERRLAEAVEGYVTENGRPVGFPALMRFLDGTIPTTGDWAVKLQRCLFLWRGISRELAEQTLSMVREGKLVLEAGTHDWLIGMRRAKWPIKCEHQRFMHLGVGLCLREHARRERILDPAVVWIEEQR